MQTALVFVIFLVAAAYLIVRFRNSFSGKGGCGCGCSGCSSKRSACKTTGK